MSTSKNRHSHIPPSVDRPDICFEPEDTRTEEERELDEQMVRDFLNTIPDEE